MSQTQKIVNTWYHFSLDTSHKPTNQFYGLHHTRDLEAVRGANLSVLRWVDSNRGFVLKWIDDLLKHLIRIMNLGVKLFIIIYLLMLYLYRNRIESPIKPNRQGCCKYVTVNR